jgi:hypothetical protein
MTDEQFKQLMDKLEELKTYRPSPYSQPIYQPPLQNELQRQLNDGFPTHWNWQARD